LVKSHNELDCVLFFALLNIIKQYNWHSTQFQRGEGIYNWIMRDVRNVLLQQCCVGIRPWHKKDNYNKQSKQRFIID